MVEGVVEGKMGNEVVADSGRGDTGVLSPLEEGMEDGGSPGP